MNDQPTDLLCLSDQRMALHVDQRVIGLIAFHAFEAGYEMHLFGARKPSLRMSDEHLFSVLNDEICESVSLDIEVSIVPARRKAILTPMSIWRVRFQYLSSRRHDLFPQNYLGDEAPPDC